jgi:hypothetical protein
VLVLAPDLLESVEERVILEREYEHPGCVRSELDAALGEA